MTCQVVLRSAQKVFTSEEKCQIINILRFRIN